VRGAVTVGEARDSESVDEISDGLNNLADDRGDIFRRYVDRVKMGYAKTVSKQQREEEREVSRRSNGEEPSEGEHWCQ